MSALLDVTRFPLRGSSLIEASAGTGKTYTIALLYVRLVLGHGMADGSAFTRPLVPPEILVVTFTDAASQELVDRIRARLTETAAAFAGNHLDAVDEQLRAIMQDYPVSEYPACALKLQRAAEWMDEAAVSTIHSWCYRMLCEHAFDSLHLFTQELVSSQADLLQAVVDDYWRQQFYGLPVNVASVVLAQLKSPAELRSAIGALLRVEDAKVVYAGEPVQQVDGAGSVAEWVQGQRNAIERVRSLWKEDQANIEALLAARWDDLDGRTHGKLDVVLPAVAAWVDTQDAALPPKLENLATGYFKLKSKAKNSEPPAHAVFDAIGDLRENFPDEFLKQRFAELKCSAAQQVCQELNQRLLNRAELGFDDMLKRLHEALQGESGPRLAAAIREQFPVALIDEFQDTDPIQYGIFNAVYGVEHNDQATAFVMIGDPKQAIYAFRGADIYTYLQARAATEGRHYTLGKNFRSAEPLVRAVNGLFQHAEQHQRGAFRFNTEHGNPVPFEPVACQGRKEALFLDGAEQTPVTAWYLPGMNEHGVTGPWQYRHAMAQTAASEIVRWLQLAQVGRAGFVQHQDHSMKPLRAGDIAILVRSGSEARAVRDALSDRGVHSVYLSDKDSVFSSAEAGDVLRWLRAVAEPDDNRLLKAALASATLALPLDQLGKLFEDETTWENSVMRFRAYRVQWQKQGVLPMLRQLLVDYRIAAGLLAQANGERALTNLLHIAEWLQQQSVQVDGELALVRVLADRIANPTEEDVIRLESDADLVKVVTIHKSKGLEYPLVLLPFICSVRKLDGKNAKVVSYHHVDESQQWLKFIELAGKPDLAPDAYRQANMERIDEDMRLLYVALTRAQHAVWLGMTPIGSTVSSKETCLQDNAMGYLLNGEDSVAATDLQERMASIAVNGNLQLVDMPESTADKYVETDHDMTIGEARHMTRPAAPEPWWVASYSALKTGAMGEAVEAGVQQIEPEDAQQDTADEEAAVEGTVTSQLVSLTGTDVIDMHAFPRGPKPGTFLHDLLEWAALQGFAMVAENDTLRREHIARCCSQRKWEKWTDTLDSWMKTLLTTPLLVGGQQITLSNISRCLPEMEFWFESRAVNTVALDTLVQQHTLQSVARPQLLHNFLNGLLKGFIDLVFEYNGQYFVADWKSNWLGDTAAAYTSDAMCDAVLHKRYELQYTLYTLALHRHLQDRLQGDYDYDRHIGGAVYLFLRGIDNGNTRGVHFEKPPKQLIESLDALFSRQPEEYTV